MKVTDRGKDRASEKKWEKREIEKEIYIKRNRDSEKKRGRESKVIKMND